MIVKNEEANLPRCLASAAGLADETIITDTGSTDRTVEIAKQYGALVERFEWCDDFAAACNASLGRARGEWILLIDADEELAPGSHDQIRALIRQDDAFAFTQIREDFMGENEHIGSQTELLQTRLHRSRPAVRYTGRVHQQLEPSLSQAAAAENRFIKHSDVRIRHYGYLGDAQPDKLRRNIRLLELELQDRPGSFHYLVSLAASKLSLSDESGIEPLTQAAELIATDKAPIHSESAPLAMLLERIIAADKLPDGFPLTHADAERITQSHFSDCIPLLWQLARRRFLAGEYQTALELVENIQARAASGDHSRLCSFNPEIVTGEMTLNLGVCYAHVGRIDDAIACFRRLASHPRHGQAARQNIDALSKLNH